MIKELWLLVKMLFASKPIEVEDLDVMQMEYIPFKGYKWMMWCGWMIYRKENEERILSEIKTDAFKRSLSHERIHLAQAQTFNSWIGYYLSYFWHWVKHCPWIAPSSACYYLNRYECEAYAQEDNPDYWKDYNRKNLRTRYTIEDAKNVWRALGGTSKDWKEFLKTI